MELCMFMTMWRWSNVTHQSIKCNWKNRKCSTTTYGIGCVCSISIHLWNEFELTRNLSKFACMHCSNTICTLYVFSLLNYIWLDSVLYFFRCFQTERCGFPIFFWEGVQFAPRNKSIENNFETRTYFEEYARFWERALSTITQYFTH